jgi:polyisoprenyl-teichoic acid--peptidoglycan teichoic acid transferase
VAEAVFKELLSVARERRKKRKNSFLKKLLLLIFTISFVTLLVVGFFPQSFINGKPVVTQTDEVNYLEGRTFNILLLGFDRSADREEQMSLFRPDTIMIAAVDFSSGKVSLVSIPRDSYVSINGSDTFDKINHSYMYGYQRKTEGEDRHQGGIDTVIRTIEDFIGGIPIHAYFIVDMDGAKEIVDAVGGVVIEVENDVRSNYGRGDIQVAAGRQRLDGDTFMQYVRSRADNLGGERGRTQRQQKALIALFSQLLSARGFISLPAFYRAVDTNIETSLNALQLLTLGLFGLRLDYDLIEGYVFAGEGKLSNRNGNNIYYLVIDNDYRLEIINRVFGLQVERLDPPYLPGPIAPEPSPEEEPEFIMEPEPDELPPLEEQPDPVPDPEPEPEEDSEPESETESPPDPEADPSPGEDPPLLEAPLGES